MKVSPRQELMLTNDNDAGDLGQLDLPLLTGLHLLRGRTFSPEIFLDSHNPSSRKDKMNGISYLLCSFVFPQLLNGLGAVSQNIQRNRNYSNPKKKIFSMKCERVKVSLS